MLVSIFIIFVADEIISHRSQTTLPKPNHVIDRSHELAETDNVSQDSIFNEIEDFFESS